MLNHKASHYFNWTAKISVVWLVKTITLTLITKVLMSWAWPSRNRNVFFHANPSFHQTLYILNSEWTSMSFCLQVCYHRPYEHFMLIQIILTAFLILRDKVFKSFADTNWLQATQSSWTTAQINDCLDFYLDFLLCDNLFASLGFGFLEKKTNFSYVIYVLSLQAEVWLSGRCGE